MRWLKPILLTLGTLALAAAPAAATSLLKLTPEQVDQLAARIVVARCVAVRPTAVPGWNRPATEYVLQVERVLKGQGLEERLRTTGGRLTIRQAGVPLEDGSSWHIPGMPRYEVGARYRLALNGDSTLGLTSPVGLGQGVRLLDAAGAGP
jgi:hypothetical protein